MQWPFSRPARGGLSGDEVKELLLQARRARTLIEESREMVVVLDDRDRVIGASRRAREGLDGIAEGRVVPPELLAPPEGGEQPFLVPYEIDGRREALLYLSPPGETAAYEELRAGFTASVSHELRTPLARLLALLETAGLPGEDPGPLVAQARAEVDAIRELIDDVLFLSELETGRVVVALRATRALPIVSDVLNRLQDPAERAAVELRAEGDPDAELPLRPRMLRVVSENLAQNAIRYAGPGATFTLRVGGGELVASDDGAGVSDDDLPRLFERFYRGDRVRGSRGTGLGLAVVKHVVAAAGGTVEAVGAPGHGLTITCRFPAR